MTKTRFIREPRFLIFYIGVILLLVFANTTEKSLRAGIIMIVLGEAIRVWATSYLRKSDVLITTGPYALIRHPLYSGTFLIGLGFCIIARNWYIISTFIILYIFVYREKIKKEEGHLLRMFGSEFGKYKADVPAVIPGLNIFSKEKRKGFNLGYFFISRELNSFLWVIFFILIFHLREEVFQEKESFFEAKNLVIIILSGFFLFLACFNSLLWRIKQKKEKK